MGDDKCDCGKVGKDDECEYPCGYEDPRLTVVTEALSDTRDIWIEQDGETIRLDLENVAKVAILASDRFVSDNIEYCRWMCHLDEQQNVVERIVRVWKERGLPVEYLELVTDIVQEQLPEHTRMPDG